jgi:SAM-dependent methyltransferase
MIDRELYAAVNRYYSDKILQFGATPNGVDWNSSEGQELRFMQLLRITEGAAADASLLDYGCGYGGLLDFIKKYNTSWSFTGFDISEEMIKAAKAKQGNDGMWITELPEDARFDYVVASGIFNVIPDGMKLKWEEYVYETINRISSHATRGFAFNMLTAYSDPEYRKDYLWYASPQIILDYCLKKWPRRVSILHDYGLYEFTVLVRLQ